ncbi:hypothetical protein [Streptomyces lasiicapitis]
MLPAHVQDRARSLIGEDIALVRPYLCALEARRAQADQPTVQLVAI